MLLGLLLPGTLWAQPQELKGAAVLVAPSVPAPMRETAPKVLREEIARRTGQTLPLATSWPKGAVIVLALASDREVLGVPVPVAREEQTVTLIKEEGYRVVSEPYGKSTRIWVLGVDARGVLFGTGWLLRHLHMTRAQFQLDQPVDVASAPAYPIRGHQLGYRNTANSYDAWTVAQYEQYIRELAIFGTNAIENIPLNDDDPSVHLKLRPAEMNIKMSEICRAYDLDYWVWTPVTIDLVDADKRAEELKIHEKFYRETPKLDHIFVPGGDPGHNHPREVLPFLKDLHASLIKYHPKAKIWLSLQGFNVEQVDYFYRYLTIFEPTWLQGVVSGPSSPPMSDTRYRLPIRYQHRQYPDITHTVRCEFPMEKWDQAYALTLGREPVNPRPYGFAQIHATWAPYTDGFVSYSDGCHDDLNKVLWNLRGWNPEQDVREILQEYSGFFFGKEAASAAADGIAALEQNWKGPLAENGGVESTLFFWKNLESKYPALKTNWRWQMLLLRAYYDAYTRRRLIYEQELEKQANAVLARVDRLGAEPAMNTALALVEKADKFNVAPDLREKIEVLCEELFQSIGLQTSVPKHHARGYERGCVLDFVDYPLNNRWWLADEFAKIKALPTAEEQRTSLHQLSTWENPGPGSYYDDVSNVSKGTRVSTTSNDATDVAWWNNGFSRARLSSQLFQKSPVLHYDNLQPGARYKIRVVGYGEALLRVDGHRLSPVVYNREADAVKEWIVPLSLTQDGRITVTFDGPEESHLNWREQSRISDVWLLRQ